jgi:2'-5' RNA ligase
VSHFALVVPFPELSAVVDEWRERTCAAKPSHGLPPHVTLVVPSAHDVEAIADVLRRFRPFDVAFTNVDRFPGTVWLAPEPAAPFRRMTEALTARFPEHPPYGGIFSKVVPHLTVAQSELDTAAAELRNVLPLTTRARSALLLEKTKADEWRSVETFPFEAV